MIDKAIYAGDRHPELYGHTALVQPAPDRTDVLLVQFDQVGLESPTLNEPPGRLDCLGEGEHRLRWDLGWHEMPIADLELITRTRVGL